jgi:hypothetical protein
MQINYDKRTPGSAIQNQLYWGVGRNGHRSSHAFFLTLDSRSLKRRSNKLSKSTAKFNFVFIKLC